MRRALLLVLVALCSACTGLRDRIAHCDDSEIRRDVSPDGRHDAVLFSRDCKGKTTSEISVVAHGQSVTGEGNAFEGDPKVPVALYVPTWRSNDELAVQEPWTTGGSSSGSSDVADGVHITVLEPVPPPMIMPTAE